MVAFKIEAAEENVVEVTPLFAAHTTTQKDRGGELELDIFYKVEEDDLLYFAGHICIPSGHVDHYLKASGRKKGWG